jgi:hypothetical protein
MNYPYIELIKSYNSIYKISPYKKCLICINSWVIRRLIKLNEILSKIPEISYDCPTEISEEIDYLTNLSSREERVYSNDEIKRMYNKLNIQTEGKYNAENFKLDLFAKYLKPKIKSESAL